MDFLVENQPANAESIFSSLWYFHCVLMICCRNRFICYLIFDKNCSICCHKSAKQSITLKRTSPFSQGCCTSRLGNPMEWWFEIYLPSKQPESWTLWQKRHPIYFLYLHWQPFCDSILCQHCRHFPKLPLRQHDVNPQREWSTKMHIHHWMGRWKCLYTCRIHSIILS